MKLWQKICICSLFFFLVVYISSGIVMIEHNRKIAFERALQQAANQQSGIQSGIIYYVMANRAKYSTLNGQEDERYIREYLEDRVDSQGIYLEIRLDDNVMYSNVNFALPEPDANDSKSVVTYKIREQNGRNLLILTGYGSLKRRELKNTYAIDIQPIYEDRTRQYDFFLKLAVAVSILLSAGMYAITGHLTKSLRILTASVKKIAGGRYQERVHLSARDEVGALTASYNEMAQAIEEKIVELEQIARQQQRFIDNFTHELRTPLTAVVGYSDLLRSTSCQQEFAQELGERIFREGKRIEKLSDLMMDLIFLEHHTFPLSPSSVGDVITEALERLELVVTGHHMKLCGSLPEPDAMILGDRELLFHLLSNLVDNAVKASTCGNEIWICGQIVENTVVLKVADQGSGIPEEEKERIFESFYMVDKARSRKNNGVGLGLSICLNIANIHHAKIKIDSETTRGTVVTITFPCYKPDTFPPYHKEHTKQHKEDLYDESES